MLEAVILGAVQGITEWLPVSSEGAIVLIKIHFFGEEDISSVIRYALFLHLGTFLAAAIYFHHDVWRLTKTLLNFKEAQEEDRKTLSFLIIATIVSAILGYVLFLGLETIEEVALISGKAATLFVSILLLITGILQLRIKNSGLRSVKDLLPRDGVILGVLQGLSVLPGFSRSGFTVAGLLLRKIQDTDALRLSFLMSLPIVLAGNIVLNIETLMEWNFVMFVALVSSFIVGLLTIHLFLRIAERVNFARFVIGFALISFIAVFI